MGKIMLTCVLALVFGFGGSALGITAFHDSFAGAQGSTGLPGAPGAKGEPGPPGADGADGADGKDGARGPRGLRGKAGEAAKAPEPAATDLGTRGCSGRSVSVVTDAKVTNNKLRLIRSDLCVVE